MWDSLLMDQDRDQVDSQLSADELPWAPGVDGMGTRHPLATIDVQPSAEQSGVRNS
jgi:hypothetical protein